MTTANVSTSTSSLERSKQKLKDFHDEETSQKNQESGQDFRNEFKLLSRIWPFIRPYQKWLFLSLGIMVIVAGMNLALPIIMKQIVQFSEKKQTQALLQYGVLFAVVSVVSRGFTFVQGYYMQMVGAKTMALLRSHVFAYLQRLRLRYLDKTPIGRLVTRATNDVDAIGEIFASGVLNSIGDIVLLVGIAIAMLLLDFRLALISFATIPIIALLVLWVRSRSKQAYRDIRIKTARLNAFIQEQVSGIAVVQAYRQEKEMQSDFDELNQGYRDANKRSIFYEALLDAAIEMISTLCMAFILWWLGLKNLRSSEFSFGVLVAFIQYIKQFLEPINLLAQRYTILQSALTGAERIFQLLDEKEVEEKQEKKSIKAAHLSSETNTEKNATQAIEFKNVYFSYKTGVPVLQDITFSIKKGETIALVGTTGSGKTTITSLLLQLYEPQQGSIQIFGEEISTYSLEELRHFFAVIPQDVILFPGTFLSNIALGDPNPDQEKVKQILQEMGVWDFMERFGLHSPIEERGSNLSVGERQILAFARAMYRDAPIFILDEATASIDSETESQLQKALHVALEKRTALIIAHRLSTIQSVDRIIVIHKGQIAEQGTHHELLMKNGIYSRLYQLQFAKSNEGIPL